MIQPVNALTPRVMYRGTNSGNGSSENPINRKTEKKLAILNAGGISVAIGAAITAIARAYTSCWKNATSFGIGAAAVTMLFVCPKLMYKSGINSYAKQKEMDVFTKEKEVQKKLLSEVNTAIDEHSDDLQDKLANYSKTVKKP